jgi:hypothetical protein
VVSVTANWEIVAEDNILWVTAPPLEARPPAIDTDSIRATYDGGLLILRERERLEELQRSLTAVARQRSNSQEYLSLVRETCRKRLESFLGDWAGIAGYEMQAVRVQFADEQETLDALSFERSE